jgi:hypothetical protein
LPSGPLLSAIARARRSIRMPSFSRAPATSASMSRPSPIEPRCSCRCAGRPSARSKTSLTARKATRSSSEAIRRPSRTSARSRSSSLASARSSSWSTSNRSRSSLRRRIFSARARPPFARSSRVNSWASAPFLRRRDCFSPCLPARRSQGCLRVGGHAPHRRSALDDAVEKLNLPHARPTRLALIRARLHHSVFRPRGTA